MTHQTVSKPRLPYFDMMKGVAIFLVVMGHIITFSIRGIDRAFAIKLIGEIHMPLFFFISGWFVYKYSDKGGFIYPTLGKRALQLLVPMIVVSSIWIAYFPTTGLQSPLISTFKGLWLDSWKNGYWFTPVLFEIILLYCIFIFINKLLKINSFVTAFILVAIIYIVVLGLGIPQEILDAGSLQLTATFFPVFIFGVLAHKFNDAFEKTVQKGNVQTFAILIGFSFFYATCWHWEFGYANDKVTYFFRPIFHICLAIITYPIFKNWSEIAYKESSLQCTKTIANIWQYLGKKSLAIYLLHYFLLFPLTSLQQPFEQLNLSFVPLVAFSAVCAAIIIAIVLGIEKILSLSPMLSFLFTGDMAIFKKTEKK